MAVFRDRRDAGRRLAARLTHLRLTNPVVLGLPRGGVPVAAEVARALGAPLDVIVVRKLGVPFQPELGMGAIGEGGVRVLNDHVVALAGVTAAEIARIEAGERAEVERRAQLFRGNRPALSLAGRTVIIVDDGIATGATARAALQVARAHGAARVVLAVPVAARDTLAQLARDSDEVVCLDAPATFVAVGQWYQDFTQTSDREVRALLAQAAAATASTNLDAGDPPGDTPSISDAEIRVPAGGVELPGHLTIPDGAVGIVLFAHGSGSSRHSPRNRFVARALNAEGLATLLLDLLTPTEEHDRTNVFDIELLADRLAAATLWLEHRFDTAGLPIGYFGASTGAAAALWAAATASTSVRAVVSRGGRPDLAHRRLAHVRAATLLIVGGRDEMVLRLNQDAARQLTCTHHIEVVPGATHLFEEPGALERVAELAGRWFCTYLPESATGRGVGSTRQH